jgi:hypothetical protein
LSASQLSKETNILKKENNMISLVWVIQAIRRTEPKLKFANIMEEKCAQYSESELNAAKMDGFSKIPIAEE